jgi:Cys-tRNA synthase (O-phospho-L-seryl-tRNA:Cys-tRNA synthase)
MMVTMQFSDYGDNAFAVTVIRHTEYSVGDIPASTERLAEGAANFTVPLNANAAFDRVRVTIWPAEFHAKMVVRSAEMDAWIGYTVPRVYPQNFHFCIASFQYAW